MTSRRPDDLSAEKVVRGGPLPLRYQLAQHLTELIVSGSLKPGERLPSEQELMNTHGVSRSTVRDAVRELIGKELVRIERGLGTFVSSPPIEQELTSLTGFVEDMLSMKLLPTAQVLSLSEVKASGVVAEKLKLKLGDPVVRIERVRLANGHPISFDLTFLPADIGEPVSREDLNVFPIFSILEDKLGIVLHEADYAIEARSADSKIAQALRIDTGAPLLVIERTVYSSNQRPVDYEQLFYRADRFRYQVRLRRKRPDFRLWELQNKLELHGSSEAPVNLKDASKEAPHKMRVRRGSTDSDAT